MPIRRRVKRHDLAGLVATATAKAGVRLLRVSTRCVPTLGLLLLSRP